MSRLSALNLTFTYKTLNPPPHPCCFRLAAVEQKQAPLPFLWPMNCKSFLLPQSFHLWCVAALPRSERFLPVSCCSPLNTRLSVPFKGVKGLISFYTRALLTLLAWVPLVYIKSWNQVFGSSLISYWLTFVYLHCSNRSALYHCICCCMSWFYGDVLSDREHHHYHL